MGLSNGGQWEFPGGKCHQGEDHHVALRREIKEELQVEVAIGDSLGSYLHKYSDKTINLHCFLVQHWTGEFVPTDHDQLQWCDLHQLKTIGLSAADLPFVERLQRL